MHSSNLFILFAVDGFRSTIRDFINPRTFWNLHDCKYKGDGTTLMVFNTGIDKSHPSFSSKSLLLPQDDGSYDDEDENGHGTFCAGIACGAELEATLEDGISIKVCGVAPNAKLGIWKARNTVTQNQRSEFMAQLKSLTEYVQEKKPPIDVLVIPCGMSNPDTDMKKHIERLDDMGIIIVCSASNYGLERNSIAYPARFPQTICIGSSTPYHEASVYSPEGDKMEFLGIGENIIGPKSKICKRRERGGKRSLSEESSEMFLTCNGTSFSASAVGGLICLILQTLKSNQEVLRIREELNREFIVELLKRLTNTRGQPHHDRLGFGVIDGTRLKRFFKEPNDIIKEMRNDKVIVDAYTGTEVLELEKLRKEFSDKGAEEKALSDELEKLREESSNRAAERKVLEMKFTDFEKDMESLEDTISSKQRPTGEEEMKEKLAELKVYM